MGKVSAVRMLCENLVNFSSEFDVKGGLPTKYGHQPDSTKLVLCKPRLLIVHDWAPLSLETLLWMYESFKTFSFVLLAENDRTVVQLQKSPPIDSYSSISWSWPCGGISTNIFHKTNKPRSIPNRRTNEITPQTQQISRAERNRWAQYTPIVTPK